MTSEERSRQTKAPAWRLMVPDREVEIVDGLQGVYRENLLLDCGDFIIRRADGVYAYQLAVVTDDADGGITQVVRGFDLLCSAPRQNYLYALLGKTPPQYYHVPLLVAADGRRLSKREKDLDLGALRQNHTPQQLLGYLAHLAGVIGTNEAVSANELAQVFDWKNVKKEPIVID